MSLLIISITSYISLLLTEDWVAIGNEVLDSLKNLIFVGFFKFWPLNLRKSPPTIVTWLLVPDTLHKPFSNGENTGIKPTYNVSEAT